jgi:Bacterial PH domain
VAYLALGFAILAGLILLGRWFRASRDEFVVTDRRVIRGVGLISRAHEQAPIDKIQDITVNQSGLGRIFDYGDVILETASERGTLEFPSIASPEAFRTAIWGRPRTAPAAGAVSTPAMAGMPAAPAVPAGPAPGAASARMEELEGLRRRGMVTEAEYAEKRREILSHL